MKDFRRLKVWEKSHALTLAIYKATLSFPKQELYALTNQIQRAAVSIPTNIAEGCGKDSDAELGRYFKIAMGSLQASWNIFFCLLTISNIFQTMDTKTCRAILSKFARCSTLSSNV